MVRPHAPPNLRVLDYRAGADEKLDVVGVRLPAAERLGDAAAGEALREDLAAGGLETGVAAVEEGRVGRDRQHLGEDRPQAVADRDRAVRVPDPDVNVEAEGVVPPRDVAQFAKEPPVVLGVDDPLLPPRAPRMRSGRHQERVALGGQAEQVGARLPLAGQRGGERRPLVAADLDL